MLDTHKVWRSESMLLALQQFRGGEHFQLFMSDQTYRSDDTSGVRGNGDCAITAFLLGYLDHYQTEINSDLLKELLRNQAMTIQDDFFRDDIMRELQEMLDNTLSVATYTEYYFDKLSQLFDIEIQVKNTANSTLTTFGSGERTIYLSTDEKHYDLYLLQIPERNEIWHRAFRNSWTIPKHPNIEGTPMPSLGRNIWEELNTRTAHRYESSI